MGYMRGERGGIAGKAVSYETVARKGEAGIRSGPRSNRLLAVHRKEPFKPVDMPGLSRPEGTGGGIDHP